MSQLGDAIRDHRLRLRLSQAELGHSVGVSRVSVGAWERGESLPTAENLARMASLFGVPESMLRYPDEAPAYGLTKADVARVPGLSDALLQMPDHVHAIVWPFLGEMARAGIAREARDEAEVFLTRLSRGLLTPGHPSPGAAVDIADAVDAMRLLRELFERRGVRIGLPPIDIHETPDPDAMSGADFVRGLDSGKKKPKAG